MEYLSGGKIPCRCDRRGQFVTDMESLECLGFCFCFVFCHNRSAFFVVVVVV